MAGKADEDNAAGRRLARSGQYQLLPCLKYQALHGEP
jgi:hypothetical protein